MTLRVQQSLSRSTVVISWMHLILSTIIHKFPTRISDANLTIIKKEEVANNGPNILTEIVALFKIHTHSSITIIITGRLLSRETLMLDTTSLSEISNKQIHNLI